MNIDLEEEQEKEEKFSMHNFIGKKRNKLRENIVKLQ
jgi:hypothetical protein